MGEVYRARDVRLKREVALKVLAESAVGDADRLERFERETRAVAALNHPNILAIHDTGSHHGVPYAVTELLEGETLAERLRGGVLAPKRAAEIVCQIAEGLDAAHTRGVIHRDIKPDNIFLTNDGRAKILDFGIARIERRTSQTGLTGGRARGSSAFLLVGTAGFMSPEQVRGKPIDSRTDIFSLGAVFFEMLTGRQAFSRESAVETFGAVLKDDPAGYPEAEKIPPDLKRFVFRCLEKDPADRYQSARDLLLDLRALQAEGVRESAARVQFRSEPPWKHRKTRVLLRALGGILLFVLGILAGRRCGTAPSPTNPQAGSPTSALPNRLPGSRAACVAAVRLAGVELVVEKFQRPRDFASHVRGIAAQYAAEPLIEGTVPRLDQELLLPAREETCHHEQKVAAFARNGRPRPPTKALEPDREVLFELDSVRFLHPILADQRRMDQSQRFPKDRRDVQFQTILERKSRSPLSADLHRPDLSDSFL